MAKRLVLHVGAMKSGTTYLQSLLFANQAVLAGHGVLVPGASRSEQGRAVRDVLGHGARGGPALAGSWDRLVEQMAAHDGTAVVSVELLGPAVPANIEKVLAPFAEVDLEVVVTARDLNRNLVAMWQETLQNGRSWTFSEFVDGARAWRPSGDRAPEDRTDAGVLFWRQQNIVRLCRGWSLASGGVRVVTVPPPGAPREVLRDRFVALLGVPAEDLAQAPRANESLGAASAETVRRLNELLDARGLAFPRGMQVRKYLLAKRILAERRRDEPAVGLPVEPWVREQTDRLVHGLQELGVGLVGDWSELTPQDVPGRPDAAVDAIETLEAALAGLTGLVADAIER